MASLSGNKLLVLFLLALLPAVMIRCSSSPESEEAVVADTSASCRRSVNPNGDSELSLLMRQMLHSSESMRSLVKEGRLPDKFPSEFLKIHTATPTSADTKKASYNAFADSYIENLNALYHAPKEQLTVRYNAVIGTCVSCHEDHCPGPLKAIRRLAL